MKAINLLYSYKNMRVLQGSDKRDCILTEIDEAIAELEALQSRSCDGCKFHDDVGWDDWCCDCIRKWTIDRYEAKEQ